MKKCLCPYAAKTSVIPRFFRGHTADYLRTYFGLLQIDELKTSDKLRTLRTNRGHCIGLTSESPRCHFGLTSDSLRNCVYLCQVSVQSLRTNFGVPRTLCGHASDLLRTYRGCCRQPTHHCGRTSDTLQWHRGHTSDALRTHFGRVTWQKVKRPNFGHTSDTLDRDYRNTTSLTWLTISSMLSHQVIEVHATLQ